MEAPSLMFSTKEDEEMYNSWSKQDIYEAYLQELEARINLNIEVNQLTRKLAEIRFMARNG